MPSQSSSPSTGWFAGRPWPVRLGPDRNGTRRVGFGFGRFRAGLGRAVAALAIAAGCLAAPAAEARVFRVADIQPADYPTVKALLFMGKLIEERTQGRHSLQVFHSRQLGEEKETIEQTRVGAIDIDRVNVAPLTSFVPETAVLTLPFLFRSTTHLHHVLDGAIGREILESFENHGFIGLTYYDSGARSIYNSVKPIRTPADLRGLKLRVQQSDMMVATAKALGTDPVPLPYGQVLTGLSTNLIDAAENNWPSYVSTGHYKVARFISLTEHSMAPEVLLMSKKAWETLTPEDQAIFREAAWESAAYMRQEWARLEESARRVAVQAGIDILSEIDKNAFAELVRPVYDEFVGEPRQRALLERIRNTE